LGHSGPRPDTTACLEKKRGLLRGTISKRGVHQRIIVNEIGRKREKTYLNLKISEKRSKQRKKKERANQRYDLLEKKEKKGEKTVGSKGTA